jgi:hypothetical protein
MHAIFLHCPNVSQFKIFVQLANFAIFFCTQSKAFICLNGAQHAGPYSKSQTGTSFYQQMPVEDIKHEMAGSDINDLWETTNHQPVTQQIQERKWPWLVHMLRKQNVAAENLALDWNPQGVRRHGCQSNISKRTRRGSQ